MRGWKNGYNTKVAITTEIRKMVAETHGLNSSQILVNWVSDWRVVKYPTGLIAKSGTVVIRASGFATRRFYISQEKDKHWSMN